jgi:hypothetical protein
MSDNAKFYPDREPLSKYFREKFSEYGESHDLIHTPWDCSRVIQSLSLIRAGMEYECDPMVMFIRDGLPPQCEKLAKEMYASVCTFLEAIEATYGEMR